MATAAALTSVPPSKEDVELARASGQRLAPLARRGCSLTLRVRDAGQEETIELPAGAVKLLQAILEEMASGRAVTIVPQNAELTTQQAADFLNVSRPFLVQLLEQKKLPFRLVGTHRRIRFEDVLRFKENIDAERRKVLDQLAAEAQELKMGYWALGNFTAFLDASVLYSAPLRDLLLELAMADVYRAKWSNAVHEEWIRAVLTNRHDLTCAQLERTRDLMNAHSRDALVTDFEPLIEVLELPDSDDRHVLAAAIKGRADLIVTVNLRDFPADKLDRWRIEAQHPDEFLTHQFHLSQPLFLQAVRTVRMRLKNPPKSVEDYLDTLRAQGLLAMVKEIEPFDQFIWMRINTMRLRAVTFDAWLRSHGHKDPKERWLRELYPWPVLAQVDCDEQKIGQVQRISYDDVDYNVILQSGQLQPRGTYRHRLRVESDALGWHSRSFADVFDLIATPDDTFVTLSFAEPSGLLGAWARITRHAARLFAFGCAL